MTISAKTLVGGVVGPPVRHSLSPLLHNAWLQAAGLDGVYIALAPSPEGFSALIEGCRGGAICGLNITLPFKEQALNLAQPDRVHIPPRASLAGAAHSVLCLALLAVLSLIIQTVRACYMRLRAKRPSLI